ncbi:hypothetical protein M378DRAFT_160149 [Amanita muscaria Koide BX008]|uniref:Uncharacterized protein n=1 Tax=Amanita muscaria (strain Koide BX008) TaxID=946122 RepID=A0A0C2XEB0_AMAMK|nr:hypothetical protein M378DRAFT_160149 [Amanita muscaria Koide BX008]
MFKANKCFMIRLSRQFAKPLDCHVWVIRASSSETGHHCTTIPLCEYYICQDPLPVFPVVSPSAARTGQSTITLNRINEYNVLNVDTLHLFWLDEYYYFIDNAYETLPHSQDRALS